MPIIRIFPAAVPTLAVAFRRGGDIVVLHDETRSVDRYAVRVAVAMLEARTA